MGWGPPETPVLLAALLCQREGKPGRVRSSGTLGARRTRASETEASLESFWEQFQQVGQSESQPGRGGKLKRVNGAGGSHRATGKGAGQ